VIADVVIVGGGVVGWSVAHHLARSGAGRIVVVDAGRGSTERATGGFRAQFATEINVRLSLLSLEKLLTFQAETGVDPGYVPAGYLFLTETEAQQARLRTAMSVQRAAGSSAAVEVALDEVQRRNPWLVLDGLWGAVFSSVDGFIRPLEIRRGYRRAAVAGGVVELEDTVEAIVTQGGRVEEVRTARQRISTAQVVNAAGAWAGRVGALAGVEVPVVPLRRQVAVTVPTNAIPAGAPMTIFPDGFHFRVRDGQVLLLQPSAPAADPFDVSVDPAWVEQLRASAQGRVPALKAVAVASTYAGLYEMSPDEHALLGPSEELPEFFLVNGSSGHGVMHSPALGQLAAEMLRGVPPTLDVQVLRPGRFRDGQPNPAQPLL
jgi:sarcosine oxidase, subunit beta